MKATIRRWSNEDNKNFFVDVDVIEQNGIIEVVLDGITLCQGFSSVEKALEVAESIIRTRKITNS